MQRSVLLTIIGVVLVALVATTTTATGSRRSALLADGYVEEASLFHRILRKGSHQVDLPVRAAAVVVPRRRALRQEETHERAADR